LGDKVARNNALVSPNILVWARDRLNLTLETAAEYTGVKPETLKSWEDGSAYPTVNQAKELAHKYKIPYVYFFLPTPPQNIKLPKGQNYRTIDNIPVTGQSVELTALLYDIVQRRDVMLDLYKDMETPLPTFRYFFNADTTGNEDIAAAIRRILDLPHEPIKLDDRQSFNYLRAKLEEIGILVFQAVKIDTAEMRGLSVYYDTFPIIVVNRSDAYYARNFTLIHELSHLITKTAGICNETSLFAKSPIQIERRCNQIAALVLAPDNLLVNDTAVTQLIQNWEDYRVRNIANKYYISREVLISRLYSLKLITNDFYNEKLQQYIREYKNSHPSDVKPDGFIRPETNTGSQFGKIYVRTILAAFSQELISPRDAVQFFNGLRLSHFDKLERWCFS
jgi:Zn-dependent peptidase ImmA (M78 family)/DNA-binding XRE family transcriptional regulator